MTMHLILQIGRNEDVGVRLVVVMGVVLKTLIRVVNLGLG